MKKRVNISLDEVTIERLKILSKENHMNVSTMVTFLTWKEKLQDERKALEQKTNLTTMSEQERWRERNMNDFMNKPEKGIERSEMIREICLATNLPYIDTLVQETSKRDLTVSEINRIIHKHMMDLIHEFNLEYNDFKTFLQEWEESMKEEEKIRREMWD